MHHMLLKLNHLPPGLNEQQVCERLDISVVQLRNLRHALVAKRTTSLDMKLGSDGDGSTLNELLCDEQSTLDIDKFQWEIVRDTLEIQTEFAMNHDQVLLRRNVIDDESLQSIANEIGISRERVRQKVERAKKQLASKLIEHRELVA